MAVKVISSIRRTVITKAVGLVFISQDPLEGEGDAEMVVIPLDHLQRLVSALQSIAHKADGDA